MIDNTFLPVTTSVAVLILGSASVVVVVLVVSVCVVVRGRGMTITLTFRTYRFMIAIFSDTVVVALGTLLEAMLEVPSLVKQATPEVVVARASALRARKTRRDFTATIVIDCKTITKISWTRGLRGRMKETRAI